jgi:chaperonin GroEL
MEIAGGYISSDFITHPAQGEARLENPWFLVVRGRVTSMRHLLGVLEKVAKSGRPLLVIADDIEGEALATLVVNKIRGSLRCCAVGVSQSQAAADAIDDLAAITGAAIVSEDDLPTLSLEDLGGAASAIVTANHTTIIGGALLN